MDSVALIERYFDNLTDHQREQFARLGEVYAEWNAKINVISRKDMEHIYLHHILHSLAIAKVCQFESGAKVLDVGCGGGFPSVPLAILFPEVEFVACDSIGKKIRVVEGVCQAVGIKNIRTVNGRVEQLKEQFDYIVSRAVTDMPTFVGWVRGMVRKGVKGSRPNGILYLKGGDLSEELRASRRKWERHYISELFEEEFFETKQVVYSQE
ncbi:MAG: 16S rRNA (guanine(527)-N(7))-methyltransferase RsmG [Alistipes sp.]|nr:16S rRNA (guanine(527)-N(7))-methyltransferase RsmG [Alistipes sp.]MBR0340390.1 16S rRNA (guanine(527)-N(7))-methyltransferase RsmG [Alistipes sp.]